MMADKKHENPCQITGLVRSVTPFTLSYECKHLTESKESTRWLVLTRKNLVRASGLSFFV